MASLSACDVSASSTLVTNDVRAIMNMLMETCISNLPVLSQMELTPLYIFTWRGERAGGGGGGRR